MCRFFVVEKSCFALMRFCFPVEDVFVSRTHKTNEWRTEAVKIPWKSLNSVARTEISDSFAERHRVKITRRLKWQQTQRTTSLTWVGLSLPVKFIRRLIPLLVHSYVSTKCKRVGLGTNARTHLECTVWFVLCICSTVIRLTNSSVQYSEALSAKTTNEKQQTSWVEPGEWRKKPNSQRVIGDNITSRHVHRLIKLLAVTFTNIWFSATKTCIYHFPSCSFRMVPTVQRFLWRTHRVLSPLCGPMHSMEKWEN